MICFDGILHSLFNDILGEKCSMMIKVLFSHTLLPDFSIAIVANIARHVWGACLLHKNLATSVKTFRYGAVSQKYMFRAHGGGS